MYNQIKVSVILPVYNVEKHLRECMDSLIAQTLKEIEIICVDDGSTDSSPEILKEYENKYDNVTVLCQNNLYAGVARNNGLKAAEGEYVLFLDSDDFFDKTLIEKIYNKAVKTNADVVFFGARKYNDLTHEYEDASWYFSRELLPEKEVFSRKDTENLLKITSPMPWTKLFRRQYIIDGGFEFQPLHNSNDVYFTMTAVSAADRISYVDEALVYYRVGTETNLQSVKNKNPLCFLTAYEAVYEELKRRNILEEVKKSFIDIAVSGCSHNLATAKDYETKMAVIKALSESDFVNNFLLGEPLENFANKKHYYRVAGCKYAYAEYLKNLSRSEDKKTRCIKKNSLETTPAISVVIPVYNVEEYLEECLDCIANQTFRNIEVICIDDGSTDKSLDVLLNYAEKDNRFSVYTQLNAGLSFTRNIGIEEAKGDYVYFMDSDDKLELTAFEKLYPKAVKENLDMLLFGATAFSESEECQEKIEIFKEYYSRNAVYSGIYPGDSLVAAMQKNRDYLSSSCLQLIRRKHIVENGLRFYVGIIHEDELFTLTSMVLAQRTALVNDLMFYRRLRPNSIMTSSVSFKNVYGYFCCAVKIMDFLNSNSLSEDGRTAVEQRIKFLLRSAIKKYNQISPQERYSRYGIPKNEQYLFDIFITGPANLDKELYRANIKIKKLEKKNRKLKQKCKNKHRFLSFLHKLFRFITHKTDKSSAN